MTAVRSHCVLKLLWSVDLRLPRPPPPPCPSLLLFVYLLSTPLPSPHFCLLQSSPPQDTTDPLPSSFLFLSSGFPFYFSPLACLSFLVTASHPPLPLYSLLSSAAQNSALSSCSSLSPFLPPPAVRCLEGKEQDLGPPSLGN